MTPTPEQIEAAEIILDNAFAYSEGKNITLSKKQAQQIWSALESAARIGAECITAAVQRDDAKARIAELEAENRQLQLKAAALKAEIRGRERLGP